MRSRLTLGIRCLPIIPCTAGRIRTRGTPLARKLPCCSILGRDVASSRARMGTDQASVRSVQITLPTYPQRIRACAQNPMQTARGISIIAMQLSPSANADVLDFHADKFSINKSAVKNKAIASNPERSANALILMRLLYIKVPVLSSDVHRSKAPLRPISGAKMAFTICSHIHIFVFFTHAISVA